MRMNVFLKGVYQKLAAYCAYQERAEQEVRQRMQRYELSPDEAEALMEALRADRFLSQERFARSFARGKFYQNHWGAQKIRFALRQKGVSDALIRQALQQIPEADYRQTLEELLQKKLPQLKNTLSPLQKKQRLIAYAQQKGYEIELIQELLPNFDP